MRIVHALARVLRDLPPVRAIRQRAYRRSFADPRLYGAFHGVYRSFGEAIAAAPLGNKVGFDHAEFAELYRERMTTVYPYDYPVLFWLQPLLRSHTVVFDLGGHVGVQYYGYQRRLTFPEGLKWVVCEVPQIVAQGAKLAAQQGKPLLSFTTDVRSADGAAVLIAAGALQYIEAPTLADSLAQLTAPPRHLLLNKLPLHDGEQFVTLQNAGPVIVAQYVFNRARFIEPLCALGYEVVDAWEDPGNSCHIPFHPQVAVRRYSGLYLRMRP